MTNILGRSGALGEGKSAEANSIAEIFNENTKLQPDIPLGKFDPTQRYPLPEIRAMSSAGRRHRGAYRIKCPPIDEMPPNRVGFDQVIADRRSVREFSDSSITFDELSRVLYQTYGTTASVPMMGGGALSLRAAPSAGGLYPVEIYLGVRNVSQVPAGIYHYDVRNHEMVALRPGDPTEQIYEACCLQDYAKSAAVVFLFVAVLERTCRKYGNRGYRYVLMDLGHVAQNLYLASTAIGLGCVTSGGLYDDLVNDLLGLDGVNESAMYVAFLGKIGVAQTANDVDG